MIMLSKTHPRTRTRTYIYIQKLTFNALIIHPLFACDNNVKIILALLEVFGPRFESPIPVKHVQYSVLCVANHELKMSARKLNASVIHSLIDISIDGEVTETPTFLFTLHSNTEH